MRAAAVIFGLSLAVSGIFGCSSMNLHAPLKSEGAEPAPLALAPQPSPKPLSSALLELIRQQDITDETLFAPVVLPENASLSQNDKREALQRPTTKATKAQPKKPAASARRYDHGSLALAETNLQQPVEQSSRPRHLQFSEAVRENPRVRYFIRYFSKRAKRPFANALARAGRYFPMIAKVFRDEGVPEDFAYLALIESYFSPRALSPAGALGLWQFVRGTARRYGLKISRWIDERRDPIKSTRAAAAYLKDLHLAFNHWYLATAAYNAGEQAIEKIMRHSPAKDFASFIGKSELTEETRNFVPKFVAAALIASDPQKYGFGDVVQDPQAEYEEVEVQGNLPLASLARMAATDTATLRELNPALLHAQTPPGGNYRLRVPPGHRATFDLAYRKLRRTPQTRVVTHEVKKGETLFSIARHYGQKVRALMELNGLTDSRLRIGQKLMVILDGLRGGTLR